MKMRMFVFTDEMLARALAAWEARRRQEGASELQAKDDTETVIEFFRSEEVAAHKMTVDGGRA